MFHNYFCLISVRVEEIFYTYLSYKAESSNCPGALEPPNVDCLLHPTMFCNGVVNCPGCTDEIPENCTRAPCENGRATNITN